MVVVARRKRSCRSRTPVRDDRGGGRKREQNLNGTGNYKGISERSDRRVGERWSWSVGKPGAGYRPWALCSLLAPREITQSPPSLRAGTHAFSLHFLLVTGHCPPPDPQATPGIASSASVLGSMRTSRCQLACLFLPPKNDSVCAQFLDLLFSWEPTPTNPVQTPADSPCRSNLTPLSAPLHPSTLSRASMSIRGHSHPTAPNSTLSSSSPTLSHMFLPTRPTQLTDCSLTPASVSFIYGLLFLAGYPREQVDI